ncbi:hypothetical protein D3C84_1007390 [compost metagenome]
MNAEFAAIFWIPGSSNKPLFLHVVQRGYRCNGMDSNASAQFLLTQAVVLGKNPKVEPMAYRDFPPGKNMLSAGGI